MALHRTSKIECTKLEYHKTALGKPSTHLWNAKNAKIRKKWKFLLKEVEPHLIKLNFLYHPTELKISLLNKGVNSLSFFLWERENSSVVLHISIKYEKRKGWFTVNKLWYSYHVQCLRSKTDVRNRNSNVSRELKISLKFYSGRKWHRM